jgi:hypothetical protein
VSSSIYSLAAINERFYCLCIDTTHSDLSFFLHFLRNFHEADNISTNNFALSIDS